MKRIAAVTLIVAASFISAGTALAQDHKVTANIPFNFTLNGRSLPAGHYTIGSDSNSPNVLRIEDRDDSVYIMTMAMPDSGERQTNNTMLFHRYGNQYFLSSIRANSSLMNCHLTTSKQEKWAKAQTREAVLRVNDDVMIALK
ncbi:MAG TPA: hypothetical protein VK578_01830 [Edaphobacter sp.]|jgi:hypothetical protein|nr:hypothetical protein [Edaphobacter sp.]